MRGVLNKIFIRKLGPGKFLLSAIAFIVGLTLVLLALQGYLKLTEFINPRTNVSNYIIISKEVEFAHTLLGGKAQFSDEEISNLQKQPFVDDVGIFKSNTFQARAYLGGNLGFSTELFFESVPSRFIDNKPYNFEWEQDADFLPLIISQDFLNLYNFGYAIGRGTPQLSKSTVQLVPLKVEIYGPSGREVFDAKVVGFSDRIASILVPDEFLSWANSEIGAVQEQNISRAIVKVKTNESPSFEAYMKEHHIRISDDKLKLGRIMSTVNVVMSVLIFVGTAFMLFALIIVTMNFSLMVAQAKEEVSLLLQLGYKSKHLVNHLLMYLWIFLLFVTIVSALVFFIGNGFLISLLQSSGVDVNPGITTEVLVAAFATLAIAAGVSWLSIQKLIRSQL